MIDSNEKYMLFANFDLDFRQQRAVPAQMLIQYRSLSNKISARHIITHKIPRNRVQFLKDLNTWAI